MDELAAWLKQEGLSECLPYLSGLTMAQVIVLQPLPQALKDEKPKLHKKLRDAIKNYKRSGKKPSTTSTHKASTSTEPLKTIIVPTNTSEAQIRYTQQSSVPIAVAEPLPPLLFDKDPTPADFENLIRMCRESNKRIYDALSLAFESGHRTVDDEEFLITTELVASTLASLAQTPTAAIPDFRLFYSKLRQFCELQQDYESNVAVRPDQLKAIQVSRSKRRKVSRLNSRMHMEIKWVLTASGITNRDRESMAIRKRSLGRITVKEGQALWEAHFHDLDMDMVPWDRFIGAFMMHTKQTIDMHDEILLKHILDNDNLGTVLPKQFSSFLKCFGPLDKALENVKHLYKQKWFHDFLSVEEVHRLLTDQPPGTFLVRFSRSHSNSFALEYVAGKVLTVLIRNDMPNGVFIKEENNVEKMFPNLDSLIKHYADILKIPFQSDLVIQPWFVGDVSASDAEDMLQNRPPGTFMIRFAASGRFQYACSYVSMQGVKHTMIQKVPNGYIIEETRGSAYSKETASSSNTSISPPSSSPLSDTSSSSSSATGNQPTPTVYPSLPAFLKVWKSELRYNYDVENVPNMSVTEFMETDRYVNLSGPGDCDGNGGSAEFNGKVFAQTLATYPKACLGWQVVCDQWYVRLLGNRIVFALADGCSWGGAPREAAKRACQAIIDQVGDRDVQARIKDTMEGRHYLLRSFSVAHEQILAGTMSGTTTLLAGILMEVDPDNDEWAMVAASVGDCKAFVYMAEADRCVDVTLGNRRNLRDARDPGGRLGAYERDNLPDLRNLSSYFWPMRRNDILMIVSDGVHDNLDPESFGKNPIDIADDLVNGFPPSSPSSSTNATTSGTAGSPSTSTASPILTSGNNAQLLSTSPAPLPSSSSSTPQALTPIAEVNQRLSALAAQHTTWDTLDEDGTEKLKSAWMLGKLHSLISRNIPMNAKGISNTLIDHSYQTTSPSRDFMEANPDKPEPADHNHFPGKMDHTTCITLVVGPFFKDLISWKNRGSRISLNPGGNSSGAAGTGIQKTKIVQEDVRSEARRHMAASHANSSSTSSSSSSGTPGGSKTVTNRPLSPSTPSTSGNITSGGSLSSSSSSAFQNPKPSNNNSNSNISSNSPSSANSTSPSSVVVTPLQITPTLFLAESFMNQLPPTLQNGIFHHQMQGMFNRFPCNSFVPSSNDYSFQLANATAGDCELSCASIACGRIISTYPVDTSALSIQQSTKKRIGDPNTTHFCLDATPTRIVFSACAGTTWGAAAADASWKACHAFFHSLREAQADIDSAKDAAVSCIKAMDASQSTILDTPDDAQSTVVLLGGVISSTLVDKKWMCTFVSLGNNKAFVWKANSKVVIDLTDPKQGSDRRQPGGFLSTDMKQNPTVLSNLCISFGDLDADDIILIMSSGTYFNFDPELLGLLPSSPVIHPTPKFTDSWNSEHADHIQAKAYYRCRAIEQVLSLVEGTDELPKKFSNAIIDYCKKTTSLAREFMETNPAASEPSDKSKFPGKMGHSMCIAMRAGKLTPLEAQAAKAAEQRRDLLSTQNRPMKA